MSQTKQQKLLKFIFFLSVLGILVSGYLTYVHYSSLNSICDINKTFQCSLVSKSQYSQILGIPVSIFGLLGYTFLSTISFSILKKGDIKSLITNNGVTNFLSPKTLLFFSIIAVGFSAYLTYAELFWIKAFCVFCLISQAIILTIAIVSYQNNNLSKKGGIFNDIS